jgi:hypothetical protein
MTQQLMYKLFDTAATSALSTITGGYFCTFSTKVRGYFCIKCTVLGGESH